MFRRICLVAVMISGFCGGGQYVQATTTNFGVKAQLPANQVNAKVHYYDLLVSPNTTQTLKLQVQNTSTGTQRFEISTNRASTTSDGQLNFNQHGLAQPKSLTYNIEALMPKPRVISIAPRTTRTIALKLTAPKTSWSGVLLGAVHVAQLDTTTRVAYNIGLQLRATQTLPTQAPQLQFNGVTTKIRAIGDTISALLENPAPRIQNHLTLQANVYRLKTGKLVMKRQLSQASLAPNSVMAFAVNQVPKSLVNGKYKLTITANNDTKTWHFAKTFTIVQPVIKTKATTSTTLPKLRQLPAWLIGILIAVILALGSMIYWLAFKKRHSSN